MPDAAQGPARVGPNAVIQTAEALRAAGGEALAARVFADAGLTALLADPPAEMIPEDIAAALHRALAALPDGRAGTLAHDAGLRTAAYILAHRIPGPVKILLRALPPGPSARLLIGAIGRHAWTFAGSGRFAARSGRPAVLEIADNPLATPGCPWHRGVFEGLFRALVARRTTVTETACCARGAPACRYEIAI